MSPRIALISATTAAIGPAVAGLAEEFPQADPWNLLDDKLLPDAESSGGVTPQLADRVRRLIAHAADSADAVLLTCSMYGFIAEESSVIPVLAPDAAAFEQARARRSLLVVASLESALHDTLSRLDHPNATGVVSSPADIADACRAHTVDAVLLAQYSLTPYAPKLDIPVISGPRSAAAKLKAVVTT
ncbi:hypothetical protein [Kibdelosporangium phytohabitans]|uniref:Arylsulfatase n=1 Tax=Kibdelosporangium phytohabitans TaxID=860235 RepID=A0A0N9I8E7_9PSEU|nr:hypothetical protein [Kibdelosporangium phytohabitans]ALG12517.1 hypothetical protein AOZ06_41695 [Kibdelosporangium phytohabitans]MBE1464120.1 hypothetical protein [Kibdelosporangium phytohabitans]